MGKSQRALSQQSQVQDEIGEETVNEVVKALLVLDATKRPMKHADILSGLTIKPSRKLMTDLWTKVREALDVLGIVLSEVVVSKSRAFILTSKEPEADFMFKYLATNERAERTLLILVLAFIFMKDGAVSEDDMFRHLASLKITESSAIHEYFGDVKKKITEQFVEQLYLARTIEPGQDVADLRWGVRANLEIPKMMILEFVCRVGYGDRMQPTSWVSHYERITTEEVEGSD